jgi:hypothetical protein
MIDYRRLKPVIDEFEAKYIVTDIILLGRNGKVRRIVLS